MRIHEDASVGRALVYYWGTEGSAAALRLSVVSLRLSLSACVWLGSICLSAAQIQSDRSVFNGACYLLGNERELASRLQDKNPLIRLAVLDLLRNWVLGSSASAIVDALDDPDPRVAGLAKKIVSTRPATYDWFLKRALYSRSTELTFQVTSVLLTDPSNAKAALDTLPYSAPTARAGVLKGLAFAPYAIFKPSLTYKFFEGYCRDPDRDIRWAAITGMAGRADRYSRFMQVKGLIERENPDLATWVVKARSVWDPMAYFLATRSDDPEVRKLAMLDYDFQVAHRDLATSRITLDLVNHWRKDPSRRAEAFDFLYKRVMSQWYREIIDMDRYAIHNRAEWKRLYRDVRGLRAWVRSMTSGARREKGRVLLAAFGDRESVTELLPKMEKVNGALFALAVSGDRRATMPVVRSCLKHKDQYIFETVGMTRDPVAIPFLKEVMLDPMAPHNGRASAGRGLCFIGTPEVRKFLTAFITDPKSDPSTRSSCIYTYGKMGGPGVFEVLKGILDHERDEVHQAFATAAIGWVDDPRVDAVLKAQLESPFPAAKTNAEQMLQERGVLPRP